MDQPRQTLTVTEKYSDFGGEGKCIGYNVPIFGNLQKRYFSCRKCGSLQTITMIHGQAFCIKI